MVSKWTNAVDDPTGKNGKGAGVCTGFEDNKERIVRTVILRNDNRTRGTGD